jgi:hypothetical protein
MNLPQIRDDDDWLDLRVGQRAKMTGKIERGANGLTVTFSDWSQIFVSSNAELPSGHGTIIVERTEDGLREVAP